MGVVLREVKTGEADRILTVLTEKLGVISAAAKNSMRIKSRLLTATGLFCYSEFTLYEGKNMYQVDSAQAQKVFYGLREDIDAMALAMYCAELATLLAPEGQEAGEMLRLLLNTFYCISEKKYPLRQIKAAYEMRAISEAGFMPNLVACTGCGKYEGGSFLLNDEEGVLLCGECCRKKGLKANLSPGTLAALRHILFSPPKKIFSFLLPSPVMDELCRVTGSYVLAKIDRKLKSLDFLYETLFSETDKNG